MEVVVVECYKCGEKGHKCRKCPSWEKKVKRVAHSVKGKVHQGERKRLACLEKGKTQEDEKELRRVEEEEAAYMTKP